MGIALIVASAGSGRRLGLGLSKALVEVAGDPLVCHAVARFAAVGGIVETVVVAPAGQLAEFRDALRGQRRSGIALRVVAGAACRQESVRLGLDALRSKPAIVCVHDAARPLVSRETIDAVLAMARSRGAATAAVRPVDSVRQDIGERATKALPRNRLWLVQTPQAFRFELLTRAHERAAARGEHASDDATLVERCCGHSIAVIESNGPNLKVTKAEDLELVERILTRRAARHR